MDTLYGVICIYIIHALLNKYYSVCIINKYFPFNGELLNIVKKINLLVIIYLS